MILDTTLGTAPNHTTFRGEVNLDSVKGITTSQWNPKTGGLSTTVYEGTQAEVVNLANQAQTLGYEYKIAQGATWKIEVTYPVDIIVNSTTSEPVPLTIWELSFQQIEQSVYECKDRIVAGNLLPADVFAIDNKLRTNGDVTIPPYNYVQNAGFGTIVYNLKKSGVEGRQKFVPVLKRTVITSNNNVQNIIQGNNWYPQYQSQLFITSCLLSTYNNSTNPLSNMPTSITSQLPVTLPVSIYGATGTPYTSNYSGFVFDYSSLLSYYVGWLQYPIDIQTLSPQKVQLSQYWVFNQWSAGLLGLYDAAGAVPTLPNPANINISNNTIFLDAGAALYGVNPTLISAIPYIKGLVTQ